MEASSNPPPEAAKRAEPKSSSPLLTAVLIVGVLAIFFSISQGSRGGGLKQVRRSALMQQARQLGQVLLSYATDNKAKTGAYPDGKSSTEVFQMLIDTGYVTDPNLFYVPMPGKVKPHGTKLRPENVSFDLTGGVSPDDSDSLPVVFLTSYRITYEPDAAATPIIKPFPDYDGPRPWSLWGYQAHNPGFGIAVCYKGQSAAWLKLYPMSGGGEPTSLEHFIPKDFDAHGKTYRQLTPDGVLAP